MSLQETYDPDNIFAKILRGEIPAAKVFENEHVLSFMDAFPQVPGHTLVIPKRAGCNLLDTKADELTHTIAAVQTITRAVDKAFSPNGITITQFNGEAAGQSVFHLHFHILPHFDEQIMAAHGHGQSAEMQMLLSQAAKIIAHLE